MLVTVKVPALPSVKVVLSAEVMPGATCDGQREGLAGVRADPVGGADGEVVDSRWCPVAGVPARVAVPSPLSLKVTPVGRAPDSESDGGRQAVEVTVKVPALPSVKVVWSAEVMVGGPSTTRVKDWVASGLTPLVASMVRSYTPLLPGRRGARQGGRSVTIVGEGDTGGEGSRLGEAAVGRPVVVTVKVPAGRSVKVVVSAEVMPGARSR